MKTQFILTISRLNALLFLILTLLFSFNSTAQSYPYKVDFESNNTHPSSKSYASLDTITVDNIKWLMPGVFLGGATVSDFRNGTRSARMRLTNNNTGLPSYMEMHSNLPFGVGTVSFETAMWGGEAGGKLLVYYSVNNGSSWIPVNDTIFVPPNDAPDKFSRPINQSGLVRLKIAKVDNSNVRINVDDIEITSHAIFVNNKTPTGHDVPLSTKQLSISYDKPIEANMGYITLHEAGGADQIFDVQSFEVVITDSTAVISGIHLNERSDYYITMEEGVFKEAGGTLLTEAISSTTYWTFSTGDSIGPAVFTSLNESFSNCDSDNNKLGVFRQYSVRGNSIWGCTNLAHTDSSAVIINGGIASGLSEDNEDWLISSLPLDLSAMHTPGLSLWQKARFEGEATRTIRLSTDYIGLGDPTNATWITLEIAEIKERPSPDNIWIPIKNIDLSDYKSSPFYLAFTYECGTNGAWELTYDDIQIKDITKIKTPARKDLHIKVLGQPTSSKITLGISTKKPSKLIAEVYEITGRKVHTESVNVLNEESIYTLSNLNLAKGMYIIHLGNTTQYAVVKAIIK